jgi:hypothetical protein
MCDLYLLIDLANFQQKLRLLLTPIQISSAIVMILSMIPEPLTYHKSDIRNVSDVKVERTAGRDASKANPYIL